MKIWIACASALVMVSACGVSKDATAALTAMQITDGKAGMVRFASKSGMGDKVTLNNVTIGDEKTPDEAIKAKSLVLSGLKLTKDGKPWFTDMTISAIEPAKPEDGLTMTLATISVKHANESTGVFLASAFTKEGPGTPPPFDQWELGQISFNGLKVVGDLKKMGAGAGSFNVGLDEVSMSDLKKTIVGSIHMSGLKGDFNVPADGPTGFPIAGKFDFGTGDMKGLHAGLYSDIFGAGASGDPAAVAKAESGMFAKLTSPIDPGYDSFSWTPITAEASGVKFITTKLDQKITRNAQGVAIAVAAPRATTTLTANAADGQLGAMVSAGLATAGLQKVELYGESDATYDPASDTAKYNKYNFGLTDSFDIKLNGGFQGLLKAMGALANMMQSQTAAAIPPADGKPADGKPAGGKPATTAAPATAPDMSGLEQLKVINLDLVLTDKSLVNSLLGMGSLMGSPDPEALRKDIIKQVTAASDDFTKAGVDPDVAKELTAALASFLKAPGALEIKMAPAQPTAVLAKGQKLTKQTLGFSATYTPGPAAPAPAPAPPK